MIWLVAAAILTLNLPFGYWRQGLRRLSPRWLVAVHAPIPFAVGLRLASGQGWRLATLPLFVAAYLAGQYLGGRLRRARGHGAAALRRAGGRPASRGSGA